MKKLQLNDSNSRRAMAADSAAVSMADLLPAAAPVEMEVSVVSLPVAAIGLVVQ